MPIFAAWWLNLSPTILSFVLRHHMIQGEGHASVNSLYVDDLVGAVGNENEAFEIYHKAQLVMRVAGFNFRKWNTKSPILKTKIVRM